MIKMPTSAVLPLFAQQTAPAQGGMMMILFWGLFLAAMWFLLIAPQRKKQKEQQKMIGALAAGDEVLLAGGIYGEITSVRPDRLIVRRRQHEGRGREILHSYGGAQVWRRGGREEITPARLVARRCGVRRHRAPA